MAQYSFIKSAGDVLIPASPDAREFVKKIRLGQSFTLILSRQETRHFTANFLPS
jgi:hypothetical protein